MIQCDSLLHALCGRPVPAPQDDGPPCCGAEGSTNFAMISQFVEIPEDMVFTEEYSVRAARIAVYTLMEITKPICPVTPYVRDPRVLKKALEPPTDNWNALRTARAAVFRAYVCLHILCSIREKRPRFPQRRCPG